jgi:urea transport system ATP-binding protein
METTPIISIRDVVVTFDKYKAINHVSLDFPQGGVQFVIGPNGAGKTTILDVICGRVKARSGTIVYKNKHEIQNRKPENIVHLGITRKFQNPTIFPTQTVYENMKLAVASGKNPLWYLFNSKLHAEDIEAIDQVLEVISLKDHKHTVSGSLSHGQKQWLEIGMAVVKKPELLLVDEPIAGMTSAERQRTGELLKEIGRERTVFVVEHDMGFVKEFASSVTVMHEGRVISRGTFNDISKNEEVVKIYLGRQE